MIIFLINQTIYNIIMEKLIRKILKEMEEEKELSNLKETLLGYISTVGVLETIKMVGDIDIFNEIIPDYFSKKSHKIDLINELVNANDPDGYIYFYELINSDISLGQVDSYENGDGHTFEQYILSVGDGSVLISVYEYDEDGNMYDESVDNYRVSLKKLPYNELNKVFEVLVDYYL
jgi:hypothetical protein